MRRLYIILLTIAVVSAISVAVMVFLVPDHRGELRTDLVVGDYYELKTMNHGSVVYTVKEIDGDTLSVEVSSNQATNIVQMTRESFLKRIHMSPGDDDTEIIGRTIMKTEFGDRVCSVLQNRHLLSAYWVDANGIIYETYAGGSVTLLTRTSLIIK